MNRDYEKPLPNEHINLPDINPPVIPTAQIAPPPMPVQGGQGAHGQPSPEQVANLQEIGESYRRIRKTGAVASFSGITTLVIAIASASFTAFDPGVMSVLATMILGAVGTVELVGRRKLLRADENATRLLAVNQLAFLTAITLYCIVQMATFSSSSIAAQLPPELGPLDASTQQMIRQMWNGFYILLIVLSFIFQGGLALYYYRQQKHVARFRAAQDWEKQLLMRIAP